MIDIFNFCSRGCSAIGVTTPGATLESASLSHVVFLSHTLSVGPRMRESEWHHAEIRKSIGDAGAFNVKLIFWHALSLTQRSTGVCVLTRATAASTGGVINFPRAAIFDVQRGKRDYLSARLDLRCVTAALKSKWNLQVPSKRALWKHRAHISSRPLRAERRSYILNSTVQRRSKGKIEREGASER